MPAGPVLARLTAAVLWLLAGGCWVAQLTVPWTSSETFSLSSFADGVALVRGGGVGEAFSGWQAVALVALPAIGVVLAASAGAGGRVAVVARALLAAAGGVLLWRLAGDLADGDLDRFGDGARCALAGLLVAGLALVVDVVALLLRRRARLPTAGGATARGGLPGGRPGRRRPRDVADAGPRHRRRDAGGGGTRAGRGGRRARRGRGAAAGGARRGGRRRRTGSRGCATGWAAGAAGTSVVDAVSIEVDPATLELDVEKDGDRATAVVTGGDYRVSLDYAELPGPFASLSALFPDGKAWTGDLGDVEGPLGLFVPDRLVISTVRVDGRWYVTGVGTAIEQVTGVLLGDDLATPDLADLPGLLLERLLQ